MDDWMGPDDPNVWDWIEDEPQETDLSPSVYPTRVEELVAAVLSMPTATPTQARSYLKGRGENQSTIEQVISYAFGQTTSGRPSVTRKTDLDDDWMRFLTTATMFGMTTGEVSQQYPKSKFRGYEESMREFEEMVAPGYSQFHSAELRRQQQFAQAQGGEYVGGVLSPHLWAQMPEHRRARFMHSRPIPLPDPTKYGRRELPAGYVWRKGQQRIFHLGRALESSFLGRREGGEYETTWDPDKALKRIQMLGAHQQVFLSGLPTFRSGLKAGPGAAQGDIFQTIRGALILGGEVGGISGQMWLAPGLGDITQRTVREIALRDLPETVKEEEMAGPGDKYKINEPIQLFPGHTGFESPWFETNVLERVKTNIRRWDRGTRRYTEVPGYRWVLEQRRPVEMGGLGAKAMSTKAQAEVVPWVPMFRGAGGEELNLQMLASLKDPGGMIYEMFTQEYHAAQQAGDAEAMKRIRQELGFKTGETIPGSYAELSSRARERWRQNLGRYTQTIRGEIPVHREQIEYFRPVMTKREQDLEHWVSPYTGETMEDIYNVPVEYQAIVGDFAKMFMMEYGMKRPFIGPEEFENLSRENSMLAEMVEEYGRPLQQAYQGLQGAYVATAGAYTYKEGEFYRADDPGVIGAIQEAESLARAGLASETGNFMDLDPQAVAYRFFRELEKMPYGDKPILWEAEDRAIFTQPYGQMARMGAEGMLKETEVGGYLTRMHELMMRYFSPEAPRLISNAAVSMEEIATGERSTLRAQGYYAPPETFVGGIATGSTMLAPWEASLPNTEVDELVQIARYPTHPETWSQALSMVNVGKEEMIARGLNPERIYASIQAMQMGRGDYDADLVLAARLGIAYLDIPEGADEAQVDAAIRAGQFVSVRDQTPMSRTAVQQAIKKALHQGALPLIEERVGGKMGRAPSLASAQAGLKELLATPTPLSLEQFQQVLESGRKLYEDIGPYYTTFKRKMMAHVPEDDKTGWQATEKLHQISHSIAQRPERLPPWVQRLQDLSTFTTKGGFYQRGEGTGGRPGAMPGLQGLRQYVGEALMAGVREGRGKVGRLTPTEAAAIMAPRGQGRQSLREAFAQVQKAGRGDALSDAMAGLSFQLGQLGPSGQWATGSIAGRMYGGQWATRVVRSTLEGMYGKGDPRAQYDPLMDLDRALSGPESGEIQRMFGTFQGVEWEDAQELLRVAQWTSAFGTVRGKARDRIERDPETGEVTRRYRDHPLRFAAASQVLGINEWLPGEEATPEQMEMARATLRKWALQNAREGAPEGGEGAPRKATPYFETYTAATSAAIEAESYLTPSELTSASRGRGPHMGAMAERIMSYMTPQGQPRPTLMGATGAAARGQKVHETWQGMEEDWPTTEERLQAPSNQPRQEAFRQAFGIQFGLHGKLDVPFEVAGGQVIDIKSIPGLAQASSQEDYERRVRAGIQKYIPQLSAYHHFFGGAPVAIAGYDPDEIKALGGDIPAGVTASRERMARFGGPVDITSELMDAGKFKDFLGFTIKQRGQIMDRAIDVAAARVLGVNRQMGAPQSWTRGDQKLTDLLENPTPREKIVLDAFLRGENDEMIDQLLGGPPQKPPDDPGTVAASPEEEGPGGGDLGKLLNQIFARLTGMDMTGEGGGAQAQYFERDEMTEADVVDILGTVREWKGLRPQARQIQEHPRWTETSSKTLKRVSNIQRRLMTAQRRGKGKDVHLEITPPIRKLLSDLGFSEEAITGMGGTVSGEAVQNMARQYSLQTADVMAGMLPREERQIEEDWQAQIDTAIRTRPFSGGEREWLQSVATPEALTGISGVGERRAEAMLSKHWSRRAVSAKSYQAIKGIGPATAQAISEQLPDVISDDLRELAGKLRDKLEVTVDDVETANKALEVLAHPEFGRLTREIGQVFEDVVESGDAVSRQMRQWAGGQLESRWGGIRRIAEHVAGGGRISPEDRQFLSAMSQVEGLSRRAGIEPGARGNELRRLMGIATQQGMEEQLEGIQAPGGLRRAGGVLSDVLSEFSIGGAAIRAAVIRRYTTGQVDEWERAAEPMMAAGLRYQMAMGVPYQEAMQGTMGQLLSYQAAQRSFQMGLGTSALRQRAGFQSWLGIEPSYEVGEQIGAVGGPVLRGLGAGLTAGVLASTVAKIAGGAEMAGLAGVASGLVAPAALIAGGAVAGAGVIGQIYSESQPDALQRQYAEYSLGLRDRPYNIWSQMGEILGMGAYRGEEPGTWVTGAERRRDIQAQYAQSANFQIDRASLYLERSLDLRLDPAQARELGALLTLGGYAPEDILAGRAQGAIQQLAPMAQMGQAGAQMTSLARFASYMGIAPGQGLQQYLGAFPTVAQPAQQEQWLWAAQALGSIGAQAGQQPTQQQIAQFAEQLGQGVPRWQLELAAREQFGTLPIVQAMGYAAGSPMGQLISGATQPATAGEAELQARMATQMQEYGALMGLTGTDLAAYVSQQSGLLTGTTMTVHGVGTTTPVTSRIPPEVQELMGQLPTGPSYMTGITDVAQPPVTPADEWTAAARQQAIEAQTGTVNIPAEMTLGEWQRQQGRKAGAFGQAFGWAPGSQRGRMISMMAPTDYAEFVQWQQAQGLAAPAVAAWNMEPMRAAGLTYELQGALRRGVSPQAIGLAQQMTYLGQGAPQAFGAPLGIGQRQRALDAYQLMTGQMTYQDYQQQISQAQYSLTPMGRSMMIGGWGIADELTAAREARGIPLPGPGATPQYERTAWGIQPYGQYRQLQMQRGYMVANQQRTLGTGAWATQGVSTFNLPVSTSISSLTEEQREQYKPQIEAAVEAGKGFIDIPTQFGGQTFQMGMYGDLQMLQKRYANWQATRGIQREMMAMQYQQQQSGLGYAIAQAQMQYRHGMESLGLQREMWASNVAYQRGEFGFQYQQMQRRRGWQVEDLAYGREMAGLGYGWQMEDLDRGIRFATGREKEQLIRQRERTEERFTREEGRRGKEEERAEEAYRWEEEAHARRRQHFEETTDLQDKQFAMQKRHMTEAYNLQMAHLQEQQGAAAAMYEKQREVQRLQDEMTETEMLYRIAQQEQSIKYYEEIVIPYQQEQQALEEERAKAQAEALQEQIDAWSEGGSLYDSIETMYDKIEEWTHMIVAIWQSKGSGYGGASEPPPPDDKPPPDPIKLPNEPPGGGDTPKPPPDGEEGGEEGGRGGGGHQETRAGFNNMLSLLSTGSPAYTAPEQTVSVTVGSVEIYVNGAGDPQAVGRAVAQEFERQVNRLAAKQRRQGRSW